MKKVLTKHGYDFYVGQWYSDSPIYNIKPEGSEQPKSGYYNYEYLEKIKGVKFPKSYRR